MYTTEYDLLVAQSKGREFQNEMMAIRLAQSLRAESAKGPSLLDRLVSFASDSLRFTSRDHKASVAA